MPHGLALDGSCPTPPTASAADTEDAATIPLKVGLTLTNVWKVDAQDPDRECLTQVKETDPVSVTVTSTCPSTNNRRIVTFTRRLCRADLRGASLYQPSTRSTDPTTVGGTTMFSISSRAWRELQTGGRTRHYFVRLATDWRDRDGAARLDTDRAGQLSGREHGTVRMIVNDRVVDLPVLKVSGAIGDQPVRASILDDERLPLVLDYDVWQIGFSIRYTKICFPTTAIERELETRKRVDVYGIYFDFAQDVPRAESEPVLREIADLLIAHPDWTLAINGHTDSVGGAASNLTLSQRRSDAVRRALIDRYGIGAGRLTTAGLGASQPKATNDTVEGRAQNRRVELIRQ